MNDTAGTPRKRSYKYDWLEAFVQRAHPGITVGAVALQLFYYAGANGGGIGPRIMTLCEQAGTPGRPLAWRTADGAIRWLLENGWLVMTRRPNRGMRLPAEYSLNIPDLFPGGPGAGGLGQSHLTLTTEPLDSHAKPLDFDDRATCIRVKCKEERFEENLKRAEESGAGAPPAMLTEKTRGRRIIRNVNIQGPVPPLLVIPRILPAREYPPAPGPPPGAPGHKPACECWDCLFPVPA
jgi:hypothetical protein